MSSTLNNTNKQLSDIQSQIDKNSTETKAAIQEVKANRDFTDSAKRQKVQVLERERDKAYSELMDQKKQIVSGASNKLAKRLYSGKPSNPIQFDQAVNSFVEKPDKELTQMLKQNPSDETKRAIYKASVVSKNPKFEVLATASDLYPSDKGKIADYFAFQQQYGQLESRTKKLERRLFGDTANA